MSGLAQSISARLLTLSKSHGEDFQFMLVRYGSERLLYRISLHPELRDFVLKGATLFLVWEGQWFRTTRDLDFLGYGSTEPGRMERLFREICAMETPDSDGLSFDPLSVFASRIKEDQFYEGTRVRLDAFLGRSRISLQVDIGFGDAITPEPRRVQFPCLLGGPHPILLSYPIETALAEKILAVVTLGMRNSRMKDYYDIIVASRRLSPNPHQLAEAIRNTCRSRRLEVPKEMPIGLTGDFAQDPQKRKQWEAFRNRSTLTMPMGDLEAVVREVREFFQPVLAKLLVPPD